MLNAAEEAKINSNRCTSTKLKIRLRTLCLVWKCGSAVRQKFTIISLNTLENCSISITKWRI